MITVNSFKLCQTFTICRTLCADHFGIRYMYLTHTPTREYIPIYKCFHMRNHAYARTRLHTYIQILSYAQPCKQHTLYLHTLAHYGMIHIVNI
jgi:hypothetical protein